MGYDLPNLGIGVPDYQKPVVLWSLIGVSDTRIPALWPNWGG